MFNAQQISTIFGNIEEIYNFSKIFLADLEKQMNHRRTELSEIGQCFFRHVCTAVFFFYDDFLLNIICNVICNVTCNVMCNVICNVISVIYCSSVPWLDQCKNSEFMIERLRVQILFTVI